MDTDHKQPDIYLEYDSNGEYVATHHNKHDFKFNEGHNYFGYFKDAKPLPAQAVLDGWKWVPEKLTDEMIKASSNAAPTIGDSLGSNWTQFAPNSRWKAMLAAAPTPPSAEPVTDKKARVGNTVFGTGCKISTVLDRAYREYENNPSKEISSDALCFVNTGNNETSGYVLQPDSPPSAEQCSHDYHYFGDQIIHGKKRRRCDKCNELEPEQPDSAAVEPDEWVSIIEENLKRISKGDLGEAPFPLTGNSARAWLHGATTAYQHALEMYVPAKPQRITEQDAQKFALSTLKYWTQVPNGSVEGWFDWHGRTLLAKLNEHRELDYKAQAVSYPSGSGTLIVSNPDVNGVVIVRDESSEYRRVHQEAIAKASASTEVNNANAN